MKKKLNVLSLFDGMSCGQIALERAGIEVDKYYASELDKHAIEVTQHNYPATIQLGDVTKWREWGIDWATIDLLQGGSPCQGFSSAGKKLALDDPRSKLFFVYVDILNHIRKFNPNVKFLLENVRMKKEHLDVISEYLGVEPIAINSSLVSAQNRFRYYWANWEFVEPQDVGIGINQLLRSSDIRIAQMQPCPRNYKKLGLARKEKACFREDNKSNTLITNPRKNMIYKGLNFIRYISPSEAEKLQTVPVGYTSTASDTQRHRMLGNGWTVDVIAHIFRSMK